MSYKSGVISNTGNIREKNEDSVLLCHRDGKKSVLLLAAVADGMGGLAHGERASGHVVHTLRDWWQAQEGLEDRELAGIRDEVGFLVEKVHYQILKEATEGSVTMGTTLSLLFLKDDRFFVLQAGDSRVYRIYMKNMSQLTEDQTWCRDQVRAGRMNTIELSVHPKRHVLSNAIGAKEDFFLENYEGTVKKGEKLLICSDGYYTYLNPKELMRRRNPQKILNNSERRILTERAEDNFSAILIQI
ncbi:MAG: serine/threonine-protein phosphatase [Lachnospiraceae bacterium]|nr:serine/threonine-protein phosphatase [Lachnospiraceae bacterium]